MKGIFDAWRQWENAFDDWKATQPEWAEVLFPSEYAMRNGSMDGWKEQIQRNQELVDRLKERFASEVRPYPKHGPHLEIIG